MILHFAAPLLRPKIQGVDWTFLVVPAQTSRQLSSRGLVSVEGLFQGHPFQATLEPDGQGGHWLKVSQPLRKAAGAEVGEMVELEIAPAKVEPEPEVPEDLLLALAEAPPKAREVWADITAAARRDWIHWIISGKRAETRRKRIAVACSKLGAGNRRPCCFDRSGMYSKSLNRPLADPE